MILLSLATFHLNVSDNFMIISFSNSPDIWLDDEIGKVWWQKRSISTSAQENKINNNFPDFPVCTHITGLLKRGRQKTTLSHKTYRYDTLHTLDFSAHCKGVQYSPANNTICMAHLKRKITLVSRNAGNWTHALYRSPVCINFRVNIWETL